jgi:N-acetylglucosaminyl-diphospho-decaprenol L-rhamnosyltransferase
VTDHVVNLTVHGIGVPPRRLESGERAVWITIDQFATALDRVAGRDDVRLTFDDGNISDVEIALPMLLDRELTADFFVCPGLFGEPGRLGPDGVQELLKSGMRVGSHGWAHVDWRRLNTAQALVELQESCRVLQQIVDLPVREASIPFGSYDRHVLRDLRHFGLTRVYTSDGGRTRRDAWLQARTSLNSDLDAAWLDRTLDPNPALRQRARRVAASAVKRSRGEWRPSRRTTQVGTPAPDATPVNSTGRPRIAVVIVTYNSAPVLSNCLSSIHADTEGIELTDVVVVDNASRDDSLRLAREFKPLDVHTVDYGVNAGYAAGVNAGLSALDTQNIDAVLVLNPDCTLRPGAMATLAGHLSKPGRGIVVPKLLHPNGELQPSLRHAPAIRRSLAESLLGSWGARMGIGELVVAPSSYTSAGPWAWATGAVMMMSTRMLDEVGPWDESFLLYSEETEFALRARDHGWQLWYEPSAVVDHIGGLEHLRSQLARLLADNRVRVYGLRHGAVRTAAYRLVELLGASVRAAMGRPEARAAVEVLIRPSLRINELPRQP